MINDTGRNSESDSRLKATLKHAQTLRPEYHHPDPEGYNRSFSILRRDIHEMYSLCRGQFQPSFHSHRRVVGPVINLVKRVIFRIMNPWLAGLEQRQQRVNELMLNAMERLASLELRIHELEKLSQEQHNVRQ